MCVSLRIYFYDVVCCDGVSGHRISEAVTLWGLSSPTLNPNFQFFCSLFSRYWSIRVACIYYSWIWMIIFWGRGDVSLGFLQDTKIYHQCLWKTYAACMYTVYILREITIISKIDDICMHIIYSYTMSQAKTRSSN